MNITALPAPGRRALTRRAGLSCWKRPKAEFFSQYGFVLEKWELLAQALLEHGQKHDVTIVTETGFGLRY
jgi:hypothetical protein